MGRETMTRLEPVTGRYLRLEVEGIDYRVYFEESGQGIPLVCQHTAGSDGRQWRHLLNDADVTARYRVIVPDLPYHGKSLPPEATEWWKEEYRLTQAFFIAFHLALNRALELERPVYIGCSMGGHLAPDLALECPDEYRAVIGCESGLGSGFASGESPAGVTPEAVGRSLAWLAHPRLSNDFKAASMWSLTAPVSPEKYRRETIWEYSQGAPAVFRGDLHYYSIEHDLTGGRARRIDTSRVAVYLLTGEYDPSVSPEDTRQLAEQIDGAKFTEMKGIGHFAMSENYPVFRQYLMPVLDEIAAGG